MAVIYSIRDFSLGTTYQCSDDTLILDAAEDAGLNYPFSSRAGASDAEMAYAMSGRVDNSDGSYIDDNAKSAGFFLTDSSYPLSDMVIISNPKRVSDLYHAYLDNPETWQGPIEM